jgi:hypothetical protein
MCFYAATVPADPLISFLEKHHQGPSKSMVQTKTDSSVKRTGPKILEENNMWIPAGAAFANQMTKRTFHQIIDRVESIYAPIIKNMNFQLIINRDWESGTVNAYASQTRNEMHVAMFGGLARHPVITNDAFAAVVCHEIGHHLGGAPRKVLRSGPYWASNEGQADYFAMTKCFRKYLSYEDNMNIDPKVKTYCHRVFPNKEESAICQRNAMAGLSLATLFQDSRGEELKPSFSTPDPAIVNATDDRHPATQCRLDTYYQGALCDVDDTIDFDASNPRIGACNRIDYYSVGIRPLCWYKP